MPHYGADDFRIDQAVLGRHRADLERYGVSGISNEARDYIKSSLWSKVRKPLFDWWQPLKKAIRSVAEEALCVGPQLKSRAKRASIRVSNGLRVASSVLAASALEALWLEFDILASRAS